MSLSNQLKKRDSKFGNQLMKTKPNTNARAFTRMREVCQLCLLSLARGSLLRASLGFSLCPEKKEADAAAYDSGPYK